MDLSLDSIQPSTTLRSAAYVGGSSSKAYSDWIRAQYIHLSTLFWMIFFSHLRAFNRN